MVPIVPALGKYCGVLGRPRSRWNPGRLAIYALASGRGPSGFRDSVESLSSGLAVNESDDDRFAFFLEKNVSALKCENAAAHATPASLSNPDWSQVPFRAKRDGVLSPAETFVEDLTELMKLKPKLTRRQWIALVESLLRLGLSTHVMWICRVNALVWEWVTGTLAGSEVIDECQIEKSLWSAHLGHGAFLDGGQSADPCFRRHVEAYMVARLGLNLTIHCITDSDPNFDLMGGSSGRLPAPGQVRNLLLRVAQFRRELVEGIQPSLWVKSALGRILDDNSSRISGRAGTSKNLYEFLAHSLRRRLVRDAEMKEHDQGYLLVKSSTSRNAPWVVRPGPALIMALCYTTHRSMNDAPVTLQDLARRFSQYGVRLSTGDLVEGEIARDLESLGLVVDSPDAGGGRLVINPFSS